tara:strand:- start:3463 stop:4125 length:663 start_codon:yes stop_codon:yes gene_type:complete
MDIFKIKIKLKRIYFHVLNKSRFLFSNYFSKYKYTYGRDWFYKSEIYQKAKFVLGNQNKNKFEILEIGSFEGLSTTYFIDNFLRKSNSKITSVDPFLLYSENDHKTILTNVQIRNFFYNISKSAFPEKFQYLGLTSDQFFEVNDKKYNFIYLDGMHTKEQIPKDIIHSWDSLLIDGILWMDDYLGDNGKIKKIFDRTIESLKGDYKIIHRGYQLAIKKLG